MRSNAVPAIVPMSAKGLRHVFTCNLTIIYVTNPWNLYTTEMATCWCQYNYKSNSASFALLTSYASHRCQVHFRNCWAIFL